MKPKFRLFVRAGVYYAFDRDTGKRESLHCQDKTAALSLLQARNESHIQPALNLELARTYLMASDRELLRRTWNDVFNSIVEVKTGETKIRWERAKSDRAFSNLLNRKLIETTAAHFLGVLREGTVATNVFLRRLHNFALDLDWLPKAILPKKRWPPVQYGEKRAITFEEHQKILGKEKNAELRPFYELCWHLGGSQSDMARLKAEDVDWKNEVIGYSRKKTSVAVLVRFGSHVAEILRRLPQSGPLFPRLAAMHEKHRAKEFKRRCVSLDISGVTLHSYRYAWAERAKVAGMSERFAMEMLGHNSKAVHRAYAKSAQLKIPSLETLEAR
jgi:integrase